MFNPDEKTSFGRFEIMNWNWNYHHRNKSKMFAHIRKTSHGRFQLMNDNWFFDNNKPNWQNKLRKLWILHNCIVHPLLGLIPCKLTVFIHDYTSNKMQLNTVPTNTLWQKSKRPKISNYFSWMKHNIVDHFRIGKKPLKANVDQHDKSAIEMNVKGWS